MKSRAAVAFGPGKPLEIDVAPPKKREVLGPPPARRVSRQRQQRLLVVNDV